MTDRFIPLSDGEVRTWLSGTVFPLITCNVRMAASALLMLNREAGYASSYTTWDIKDAALFLNSEGMTDLSDSTWRKCMSMKPAPKVERGLAMLGFFCLEGTALKLCGLPGFRLKGRYSPFFTLTPCYALLKETERALKGCHTANTFEQICSAIHQLMVYACTEGETELTHELCLRAIKAYGKASAVGQRLSYIIPVIDRMFSMHWEYPRTLEPYTPLPLPSPEEAAAYFEQYGDVTPRTDMLIVRAMEALREFGESESSRGQYLKIMRRFHWRCFKAGEMYYRPELYAEYPDSERELTAQGKQKSWKSEIARRCGPVLAVVAASGVIPDDIFRREDFKFADPGLEEIHRALRIWIGKERGLSGACISLHRYVLRFTIEGSSSSSADELKRIGKAELDLILELFSRKCSVSSRATLMPLLSDVLKWLYERGFMDNDLSGGVIRPRHIRTYDPPYLKLSDQKRLELALENETWRTRAIVLLAINLGLRQSDIASLRKCDVDFRHRKLSITQCKTGVPLELPVSEAILKAIRNYISTERPLPYKDSGESIFPGIFPPFKPVKSLYHIVSGTLERAGLKAENGSAGGPHLLRYSLVHAMMVTKTRHKVITDTLGHVSEDSDRPYLSMNREMLRKCALDLSVTGKGRGFEKEEA